MASAQDVETLRRQLEELTARMEEVRQLSSSIAMNAAVTGLTEAVRSMGQSVSKPRPEDMRVGKPEPYAPGKDFDNWDFTFDGDAGTLDPAYPALLKSSETITNSGDGDSTTRTAVCNLAVPSHDAHTERTRKVVRKAGNNFFEAYRQLCLVYGTSDQEGSTGLFVQIMTYKFGFKIGDVEDRLNEFLELMRRYDEANGTDPVPDQVKKACIISNTPELQKIHLQLSRRIFRTTSAGNTHDEDPLEVDAISWKGKGRGKSGKEKKATQAKVSVKRQQSTRASRVSVETAESMDTKLLTVGTSSRPNLKAKARAQGSRNPKWQKSVKATAVNKSKKPGLQTRLHSHQVCLK